MPLLALLCAAPALQAPADPERFTTDREVRVELPLPAEEEAFTFAVFGDRTGGPTEGIEVLAQAVADTALFAPDLVMTVGDLIEGYNRTPEWMAQMREYKRTMAALPCPWFPVAGNHDVYWRGEGRPPEEHEAHYEEHFGPLWYAFRHKTAWFVVLYSDEGNLATGERNFNKPECQRMSDEQLAWLERTLERARDAEHVFVFVHHPRWLGGNYGDDWDRVHAALAAPGNVKAVFAGHIHRMRYDGVRDGIEYFTLATVGGHQSGLVPAAGWLHHYDLVTVRPAGISVVALPVGEALDPRRITGAAADEAARASRALRPEWEAVPALDPDLAVDGELVLALENPASLPVELALELGSRDGRWSVLPDHAHARLEPGERRAFAFRLAHPPARGGALDAAFALVDLRIDGEVLTEGLRIALPTRTVELPLEAQALPAPPVPESERALALDGSDDHLHVPSEALALPQGPLTLEGWLRADEFPSRQGFVAKTEGSEHGLFTSEGKPGFYVHLDGTYAIAEAPEPLLEPGRWHHVAGVFDGAEVRLYVDGHLAASVPGAGERTLNTLPLLVGADVNGRGEAVSHFAGLVDEVRLSTVARYSGATFEPTRRHTSDADTALLLHMDAPSGPWLHDASPRAAHARIRGAPRVVDADAAPERP